MKRIAFFAVLAVVLFGVAIAAEPVTSLTMAVHEIAGVDAEGRVIPGKRIRCGGSTTSDRVAYVGKGTPTGAYLSAGVTYTDHQISAGGADWYDDAFHVRVEDTGVVAHGPQDLQTIGEHEFQLRELGGGLQDSCTISRVEGSTMSREGVVRLPATESEATASMASVRIEVVAYATTEPICDAENGSSLGTTTEGRVRVWGFVDMHDSAHWERRLEYTDHQTASEGKPTWENTYNILSDAGESQFQIASQQINTFGQHTFTVRHVGDAEHVATCVVTRPGR